METGLVLGTGVSASRDYDGLLAVVRAAADSGIRCFDTAPSYRTEELLGKVLHRAMEEKGLARGDIFVQTKIDAWQMQASQGSVEPYVRDALEKTGFDYFDSLLIHWPLPEYLESTWESFVRMRQAGLIRRIGICNVRMRQLEHIAAWEPGPQIVQIERHPLRTCEAEVAFCAANGIAVQAYSPLCKMDERIRDSRALKSIAEKYGRSVGQIVLRWHMDTGVTPVFTSRKPQRVREYAQLDDFRLEKDELAAVSALNENYKMFLESWACPGF